jgi:hypothetical protein
MNTRLGAFTLAALLTCTLAFAGPVTGPDKNWSTVATEATQSLATALEDSARGRPADTRLRSVVASFDDLLDHAPLSDRDRARVLYNRGLAQLALRDPASAIFDFRRSDALAPGSAATTRELEAARAKLAEISAAAASTPPTFPASSAAPSRENPARLAWDAVRRIEPSLRWTVGLGAFVLGWLLLAPALIAAARPARRPLAWSAAAALLVAAISLGTLLAEHRLTPRLAEVVVLTEDAMPHQGPDAVAYPASTFNGRNTIPRGTELIVLENLALAENPEAIAWLRVRDRSGPTAAASSAEGPSVWIPAADVGWVRVRDSGSGAQFIPNRSPANAAM